jgi:uncharacterized protein
MALQKSFAALVLAALSMLAQAQEAGPMPAARNPPSSHSERKSAMTRSPGETVRELVDRVTRLRNGDISQTDHLANLYAPDAHVSHPFHPELSNSATVGREALRAHFAKLPQANPIVTSSVEDFRLHTTADPDLVIAEFRYAGSVDQRPLNTRCIFVVRVVAGLIVESRDYIDHLASARAYGMFFPAR